MLRATKDLLSLLSLNKKIHFQTRSNYIFLINHFGTIEDAEALADFYIKNPSYDSDLEDLLEPICLHRNLEIAEKLFAACFAQNQIKEGYSSGLVHCLGALGYEPIVPVVMTWWEEDEYSWDQNVVLGLLHFSCQGYEDKIYQAIQACMGRHLFPEMIPALSSKVPDDTLAENPHGFNRVECHILRKYILRK